MEGMITVVKKFKQLQHKPENESGLNTNWTHDLRVTGAIPYQLSYEAFHVESWSIYGFYPLMKEMNQ